MMADDWQILRAMRLSQERMTAWLANIEAIGFETYYPMIVESKPIPRRALSHAQRTSGVSILRPRIVPFLPQLVFVRARAPTRRLLEVPGVIGFLAIGSEPARISDGAIERLRERERANGGAIPGATPAEFIFERGEQVRVINGPFSMFNGIVEVPPDCPIEQIDAGTRLRLTLDFFGRRTHLELSVADVAKL